ncbi:MAG: beta-ketoacyl-[acyl-carrier-protein] synthase family protein [Rhodospirillaceae bacterium]|jgi:3-oxoacyl-[acyl-carrier-protein] synthase II|nr:beta-ketoacyl-[acyl-carrier-protein] synthase family protein [Rhodospirillaceae bacterium]MBT3493276.1 beta-ketoacyl-[acyl-carrier-protein] synthase family protein [Rhodospirillaceae bacterium]MBT3977697.1 beta-ketoacyl-[acyl-carrier-protein] synthase family protein [Rhodospirillaceae bacterium]MBT4565919.1 beta-ketoacyl-[acyl-carrier-protein] synthase family protein [Rhodospirillaceae bacterium]MBT4742831.1 beta-ketoacyl-[acyl-carrier-protein] synthase family protein [Rhodospirillaceae bact
MVEIAITGTGIVSSLGTDSALFHKRMLAGETSIKASPWAAEVEGRDAWQAVVEDFNPSDWMDRRIEEGTDLFAQFTLAAAEQAVRQAGLGELDPLRTAVVNGTSIGGVRAVMKAQYALDTDGPDAVPRKTQIQIWPNMAAAQIAMRYGLHGPSLTVTTACASSLDAIGTAARIIERGEADVAITGGTEGGISLAGGGRDGDFVPVLFYTGNVYGMEAPSPNPNQAMLPFDVKRSGIVVGEGAGMVVLERAEHARARGANILGYLRGYGSLADGFHPSSPEPTGIWEARAMELALGDADMAPGDVDALIAHATGTPKGDTAEINAINKVHAGRGLPVASIKGHIGHSGASSGAMAMISGLYGMAEDRFTYIANTDEPDPEADFEIVHGGPKQMKYNALQVNSFGFGGQNASVVLTKN